MNIDPDVKLTYAEFLVFQSLERIEHKLTHIMEKQNQMAIQLDNLVAEVTEISGTVESAVALINAISQQLKTIQEQMVDPQLLQPLIDKLDAENAALAQAVVANTPA